MSNAILNLNGHPRPQAQPMVLAQPLNDIQLVALVAVHCEDPHQNRVLSAQEKVTMAQDIVAEAVARQHEMAGKVRAAQRRLEG